jgi:hypothetical protein
MSFDRYGELFAGDPELENHRYILQERYLELTKATLPAKAKSCGWSLSDDHCFMRVVLDQLFEDCWYNHLDKRLVAYKQLNERQLHVAIALAEAILDQGESLLQVWNRQSLAWRNKF